MNFKKQILILLISFQKFQKHNILGFEIVLAGVAYVIIVGASVRLAAFAIAGLTPVGWVVGIAVTLN